MLTTSVQERLRDLAGYRTSLLEHEVKDILRGASLPVPRGQFIRKGETLPPKLALNYPLVAKVSSEKITSKSDLHGVRTGLKDELEIVAAFEE